jgi:hypothetical protein
VQNQIVPGRLSTAMAAALLFGVPGRKICAFSAAVAGEIRTKVFSLAREDRVASFTHWDHWVIPAGGSLIENVSVAKAEGSLNEVKNL